MGNFATEPFNLSLEKVQLAFEKIIFPSKEYKVRLFKFIIILKEWLFNHSNLSYYQEMTKPAWL